MKLIAIAAAGLCLFASPAGAQPVIDDLRFLEGAWRGEENGTVFEDYWTGPEAGVMLGLFKLRAGDKFNVAEFVVIAEEAETVVLRFMHFRADYSTWEAAGEPNTLVLTRAGDNHALFEAEAKNATVRSLQFQLNEDGDLVASVAALKDPPAEGLDEFSFTYQRQ